MCEELQNNHVDDLDKSKSNNKKTYFNTYFLP